MVTRWIHSAAILLLFFSTTARAAILPTDFEPKVGADYQPVGSDELAIWQSLDRLEELIRNSPLRVISPQLDAYTRGVISDEGQMLDM